MGQWVKAQGQVKVAKKMQKHPHLWRSLQQMPNQKQKIFFSMSTRTLAESIEGLNSSLALAAGDLWSKNGRPIAVVKGLKAEKCLSNLLYFCCARC